MSRYLCSQFLALALSVQGLPTGHRQFLVFRRPRLVEHRHHRLIGHAVNLRHPDQCCLPARIPNLLREPLQPLELRWIVRQHIAAPL